MELLRQELFWDVNPDELDFQKHSRFVIERVLTRGLLEDWKKLRTVYPVQQLRENIIRIRNLDNRTLSFCSTVLDIPKENFKCYKSNVWPQT